MAKAPPIIDQALERATTTLPQAWIKVEAMRPAKLRAKGHIKAQGLKLKDYEHRELEHWARLWVQSHRAELLGYATIELLFASHNSKLSHKRPRPTKSMASAVQTLGAK